MNDAKPDKFDFGDFISILPIFILNFIAIFAFPLLVVASAIYFLIGYLNTDYAIGMIIFNGFTIVLFSLIPIVMIISLIMGHREYSKQAKKEEEERIDIENNVLSDRYLDETKRENTVEIASIRNEYYHREMLEYNKRVNSISNIIIIFTPFVFSIIGMFWNYDNYPDSQKWLLVSLLSFVVLLFSIIVIISHGKTLRQRFTTEIVKENLEDYIFEEILRKNKEEYIKILEKRKLLKQIKALGMLYAVIIIVLLVVVLRFNQ